MDNWTCTKCGCDYNFTDPEIHHGRKYCPMCYDPDAPAAKSDNSKAWWFLVAFLAGCVCGFFLRS